MLSTFLHNLSGDKIWQMVDFKCKTIRGEFLLQNSNPVIYQITQETRTHDSIIRWNVLRAWNQPRNQHSVSLLFIFVLYICMHLLCLFIYFFVNIFFVPSYMLTFNLTWDYYFINVLSNDMLPIKKYVAYQKVCCLSKGKLPIKRYAAEAREPGLQHYMGLGARNPDFVTCE